MTVAHLPQGQVVMTVMLPCQGLEMGPLLLPVEGKVRGLPLPVLLRMERATLLVVGWATAALLHLVMGRAPLQVLLQVMVMQTAPLLVMDLGTAAAVELLAKGRVTRQMLALVGEMPALVCQVKGKEGASPAAVVWVRLEARMLVKGMLGVFPLRPVTRVQVTRLEGMQGPEMSLLYTWYLCQG